MTYDLRETRRVPLVKQELSTLPQHIIYLSTALIKSVLKSQGHDIFSCNIANL